MGAVRGPLPARLARLDAQRGAGYFAGPHKRAPMTKPMLPRERCDFSAIVDRPPLKLPGGARLVLWPIVNLEVWDIGRPMARQAAAGADRSSAAAGRAPLELARIRHAGRRLALF